jgi:hypothetical protein
MSAYAGCAYNAKMSNQFKVLDNHTILLSGSGRDILIKSFTFFNFTSQVTILKDNFCDFESNVLYVDGQTVDIQQVILL